MALFTPVHLSGSTNGRQIKVVATATPGTAIHTAVTGTADFDLITLFAQNSDTTARKLTIEWGGVTSPDDLIEITIPPESGQIKVVEDLPLNNALAVAAFAATANVILISGFVKRYDAA